MSLPLRPYQTDALEAVAEAAGRGIQRPLVVLPTGAGKTVCFSHLLKSRGGRGVVLAHRSELLTQAADKLHTVAPEIPVGIVQGGRSRLDAQVLVASIATMARGGLAALLKDVRTVVVDEAHHAVSKSWTDVLTALGAFRPGGPLVVGFTATPDRADGKGLGWVFEEIVFEKTLWEMILDGYLVDIRAVQVRLDVDLDACKTRGGDWVDSDLGAAMLVGGAPGRVAEAYATLAGERRGVVFTPTIELAQACASELRLRGISAEAVWGSGMPEAERRGVLRRLRNGTTQVVTNAQLLTEGFDEPSISCVAIARPTKSRGLYTQAIGRGTRRHPGKEDLLVLDCVGATGELDLITMASLVGAKDNKPLVVSEALAQQGMVGALGLRPPTDVDQADDIPGIIRPVEVELFAGRSLHWVPTSVGTYVLSAPGLEVSLLPAGADRWRVVLREKGKPEVELAHEGIELEWAQGVAEDAIRKRGLERVVSKEARWRDEPATEKQLETLVRWGIGAPPRCTKGMAADLITQATAARTAARATPRQIAALRRLGITPQPGLTKKEASTLISEASRPVAV